jgi:hypothetical protein
MQSEEHAQAARIGIAWLACQAYDILHPELFDHDPPPSTSRLPDSPYWLPLDAKAERKLQTVRDLGGLAHYVDSGFTRWRRLRDRGPSIESPADHAPLAVTEERRVLLLATTDAVISLPPSSHKDQLTNHLVSISTQLENYDTVNSDSLTPVDAAQLEYKLKEIVERVNAIHEGYVPPLHVTEEDIMLDQARSNAQETLHIVGTLLAQRYRYTRIAK